MLFPTGNRSKLHIDKMRHILIGLVNENAVKNIAFTAHKSVLLTGTSEAIDLVKKKHFHLRFLSRTLMIHRTEGERGNYFFNSFLALPSASDT